MRSDVLRPSDTPRADRVTYVELFFDLVFVFALTQLSAYLYENQTPLGRARGRDHGVRAVVGVGVDDLGDELARPREAAGARAPSSRSPPSPLVMSVAIAEAFGERAWTFAIAYVVLQLGRTGFIVWATRRHDPGRRAGLHLRPRLDRRRRGAVDHGRPAAAAPAAAVLGAPPSGWS